MTDANPRVARLRAKMAEEGFDAVVLTHPHDVRYATGYHSILERWTQQEPFAGAIVFADEAKPAILVIPEANLGIVAVLNRDTPACTFDEIRTFDMLNFCEVSRYVDPDRKGGQLAEDAMALAGAIRGECQSDIVAAIGHYTLNSYLLNALGVQPDRPLPGFRERAGEPVGMAGGPSARKMRIEPIEYQDSRSKRLNVLKTMNRHKDMNRRWMSWASYVLADEPTNSVSRRLREIAILRVGWLCNSTYEWHQHVRMAKADTDIDDDDVRAIEVGASDPSWGAEERAVLQVADELRFTGCVRDESWAELRALFSVQQIFDIVGACGQYTLVSYMLNSFGVQLEGEDVTPRWPRFRADVNME